MESSNLGKSDSFTTSNWRGKEKILTQKELDSSSGNTLKAKLNRVKVLFQKGVWLSDSKVKKISSKITESSVTTIHEKSKETIGKQTFESKESPGSLNIQVLNSDKKKNESETLKVGNISKPISVLILRNPAFYNVKIQLSEKKFGNELIDDKNTMKKFEAIQKLIEKKHTKEQIDEFYVGLKEKFFEKNGVDKEALGKCLDDLEKMLQPEADLSFDKVIENKEFFGLMKAKLEKNQAGEIFHFVEDLDKGNQAKDLKEHYTAIFDKFLKPASGQLNFDSQEETINLKAETYHNVQEFMNNELDGLIDEKKVFQINEKLLAFVKQDKGFSQLWGDMKKQY